MKIVKLCSVLILALVLSNCSNNKDKKDTMAVEIEEASVEKSLFERLGGTEGISLIVDDIVQAHMENEEINYVFLPLKEDPEHLESFKKHVREFLAAGTGGGTAYTGKDLPTAHKGLETTANEFLSAVDDILQVLNAHQIDEETKKDMLFILYSLKGQVIGK